MTSTGNEQSELFRSMTDVAKEACRAAHNALQIHCDKVVSGVVTLRDMTLLKGKMKEDSMSCALQHAL